jgi:hypothetical protein
VARHIPRKFLKGRKMKSILTTAAIVFAVIVIDKNVKASDMLVFRK